jgi:hypothetical protein
MDDTETSRRTELPPPSLHLPDDWDDETYTVAAELDAGIGSPEGWSHVRDHADRLRDSHLTRFRGWRIVDEPWVALWPPSLYIPVDADYRQHWPFPCPDDHRYYHEWTAGPEVNRASKRDGTVSAFGQLVDPNGRFVKSEAGVGIRYRPDVGLGVVHVRPHFDCQGTLRWALEMFPTRVAGSVRVTASLVVALWQEIPNGFDLLDHETTVIADSHWRDQSHGPELRGFAQTFTPPAVSASFLVQRGRTYLVGAVVRIAAWSTLTDTNGRPVPPLEPGQFKLWGQVNGLVRSIRVVTGQVHLP